jgi:hypothetical protein
MFAKTIIFNTSLHQKAINTTIVTSKPIPTTTPKSYRKVYNPYEPNIFNFDHQLLNRSNFTYLHQHKKKNASLILSPSTEIEPRKITIRSLKAQKCKITKQNSFKKTSKKIEVN